MIVEISIKRDDGTVLVSTTSNALELFIWHTPRIGPLIEGDAALVSFSFDPIVVKSDNLWMLQGAMARCG